MVAQRMIDPDTETLLAWLKAIATGGAVECEGKRLTLRSSLSVACSIKLDTEFVNKHGALAEAIRSTASRSKGKWRLAARAKSPESEMWLLSCYIAAEWQQADVMAAPSRKRVSPNGP